MKEVKQKRIRENEKAKLDHFVVTDTEWIPGWNPDIRNARNKNYIQNIMKPSVRGHMLNPSFGVRFKNKVQSVWGGG